MLLPGQRAGENRAVNQTARNFGYLWTSSGRREDPPGAYHYQRMEQALGLAPPRGVVLDAGCGEGIDLFNVGRATGARVIGIELSAGGVEASRRRTRDLPNAHVVQADLTCLPFPDETFDFIYSYGVLHHLPEPERGMQEMVRLLKPSGRAAIYLYEDFSGRSFFWRGLLRAANGFRRVTLRLPPALLMFLCRAASPVIYLLFTVPSKFLRLLPGGKGLAESFPFRHARGPFDLAGDLFDRFGAPVEWRYSRSGAEELLRGCGLEQISSAQQRGWMVLGVKPGVLQAVAG